jgi:hypothetical protein
MDNLEITGYRIHELGGPTQPTINRFLKGLTIQKAKRRKLIKAIMKARAEKGRESLDVPAVSKLLGISFP